MILLQIELSSWLGSVHSKYCTQSLSWLNHSDAVLSAAESRCGATSQGNEWVSECSGAIVMLCLKGPGKIFFIVFILLSISLNM